MTEAGWFGVNVTRWEAAYPEWKVSAAGDGYYARRRVNGSMVTGPAATLDILASMIDALPESP
jgi:hypothetical protein